VGIVVGQEAPKIKLSPEATISVITCGPGSELYSTFGHNAFRLKDPVYKYDMVYNYGTFDFNTPLFYIKFARGKLPYQLGRSSFRNFLYAYKLEKRWVKEQVLNLTPEQVSKLLAYLENNYKEENRAYKYDFFFNNCATKIGDIVRENFRDDFIFHEDHVTDTNTFRDLIHDYVDDNSWSSFGINISLGAVIDKPALFEEYQFLPDYVFQAFDNATLYDGKTPLVKEENIILDFPNKAKEPTYLLISPYFIFTLLLLLVLAITFVDFKHKKRTRWVDAFLMLGSGLGGIMIALLWFATDHTATYTNMNILWLVPINILFVRKFLLKRKECKALWKHTATLLVSMAVLLFLWLIDFQVFALAAIPLFVLFVVRYVYLMYYFLRLEEEV
jgi:hypothetical protein